MNSALAGLSLHIFRVGRQDRIHSLPHWQLIVPHPLAILGSTHVHIHLCLFGDPCSQAVIFKLT